MTPRVAADGHVITKTLLNQRVIGYLRNIRYRDANTLIGSFMYNRNKVRINRDSRLTTVIMLNKINNSISKVVFAIDDVYVDTIFKL